jgi:hypothetical protein
MTMPTHDAAGVLILDDELEHDDVMHQAFEGCLPIPDAVRAQSLPIQIVTFDC